MSLKNSKSFDYSSSPLSTPTTSECPHYSQSKNNKMTFIGPRHLPQFWRNSWLQYFVVHGTSLSEEKCSFLQDGILFFVKYKLTVVEFQNMLLLYNVDLSILWWMEIRYTNWMGFRGFHSLCVLCVRTCDQLPTCYRPTGSTDISYSNTSTTR